ncbi:MAG TPA: hypothetical protein VM345_00520 [Acidimicrobiales bacterium]|jgi:hypothetical protein|nr:hypothetical protein [Acidimicrobiales bacterium]
MQLTTLHLLVAVAVAVAVVLLLWPATGPTGHADEAEGSGAPHIGVHRSIEQIVKNSGARVVAIESTINGQRLLLEDPTPPPDGIDGEGRLWTLPADKPLAAAELLHVPLAIGRTEEGELVVDLAAVQDLHLAADMPSTTTWLREEAARWNWEIAVATADDAGVITMTRHHHNADRALILVADGRASRELPAVPAAARIIIDTGSPAGTDSSGWALTSTDEGWALEPLGLALTPAFTDDLRHDHGRCSAEGSTDTATAAKHSDRRIRVHVLGHVEITGLGARTLTPKMVELVTYLATHSAGATESELKSAVWDERPAKGRFINVVSDARRALGSTPEGAPLLPNRSGGRYHVNPVVTTDLQVIGSVDDDIEAAASALEGIDGRPFTGSHGYEWAHRQGLVEDAIAAVRNAATIVIPHLVARGQYDRAARTARRCLIAVPLDPTLSRLHRDARLAGGDDLGARRVEEEYRSATGQRLPEAASAPGSRRD